MRPPSGFIPSINDNPDMQAWAYPPAPFLSCISAHCEQEYVHALSCVLKTSSRPTNGQTSPCLASRPLARFLPLLILISVRWATAEEFAGSFGPTGSMSAPRRGHTATLLDNGKVLIAAGSQARASMPHPLIVRNSTSRRQKCSLARNQMKFGRAGHTATLLADARV